MDGVPPHGTLGGTIQWGINTIPCANSSSSRRLRYLARFSFGALKLIMDTFEDNLSASQKEEAESQQAYES